jgi:glycosyltransferase involved in cell wall biosynthesis
VKIGYDGKFLWQDAPFSAKSGYGVFAIELLRHMLALDRKSFFSVYLIAADGRLPRQDNVAYVVLPKLAESSTLRNLVAHPLELARRPVDVMLSHTTVPPFLKCRTVLLLSDIFWMANPQWLPRRFAVPRTLATRASVSRADRIVTTTEFSKREMVRYLNIPEERIEVVPHGINETLRVRIASDAIERVRHKYGISRDFILSINDIHPRKNLVGLIRAYDRARAAAGFAHQLVLVGRTLWKYPEFFATIDESPYRADILQPGYVAAEDIAALYQGATLFVYPSFYEGWGLQVHEAMCSGTPVAIANNSTLPEIAGGAAAEFDPYDVGDMAGCIRRVLENAELRATMVASGFERVKRYSWEGAARRTLEICHEIA